MAKKNNALASREDIDQLNETGRRKSKERRQRAVAEVAEDRRDLGVRRRHIDPTTCERDYSGDELEFMRAVDEYKRKNRRMFPTCSELLEVLRDLGYRKIEDASPAGLPIEDSADAGLQSLGQAVS